MIDVQVAWRCNCELWWVALVPHDDAEAFYKHLGMGRRRPTASCEERWELG